MVFVVTVNVGVEIAVGGGHGMLVYSAYRTHCHGCIPLALFGFDFILPSSDPLLLWASEGATGYSTYSMIMATTTTDHIGLSKYNIAEHFRCPFTLIGVG